jgi:hypothetical protein
VQRAPRGGRVAVEVGKPFIEQVVARDGGRGDPDAGDVGGGDLAAGEEGGQVLQHRGGGGFELERQVGWCGGRGGGGEVLMIRRDVVRRDGR